MNKRLGVTVTTIAGLLSISVPVKVFGAVESSNIDIAVLQGQVQARQGTAGAWVQPDANLRAEGAWVRTAPGAEAVVTLPNQMRVRLESGTTVGVRSVGYGIVELDINSGRAFASLPADTTDHLMIRSQGSSIQATSGDFVLDASGAKPSLQVVDGDAQIGGSVKTVAIAGETSPGSETMALDGPDVRSRSQEADEFNKKNQKKKKKGAGYVAPTNTTVPPAPPETPPPAPPETPPPVTPPPAPPVTTTIPAAGGGSLTPLWIGLGVVALGLGLGFGLSHHNSSTNGVALSP